MFVFLFWGGEVNFQSAVSEQSSDFWTESDIPFIFNFGKLFNELEAKLGSSATKEQQRRKLSFKSWDFYFYSTQYCIHIFDKLIRTDRKI